MEDYVDEPEGRNAEVDVPPTTAAAAAPAASAAVSSVAPEVPMSNQEFGQQLYPRVAFLADATLAEKITGIMLELPDETLRLLRINESALQERIDAKSAGAAAAAAVGAAARPPGCARCRRERRGRLRERCNEELEWAAAVTAAVAAAANGEVVAAAAAAAPATAAA
jgi:hypothetical protein